MKRRDLRIIVNTNGLHTNSGYASEARDVFVRLAKDGWPIAISAFFGVQGHHSDYTYPDDLNPNLKGIKIRQYPTMNDPWGSDSTVAHGNDWKADIVITFQDIWPLQAGHLKQIKHWIPWVPIDKDPVPPNVLNNLQYAYKIITISDFGQKALMTANFAARSIREGVDTEIYYPMDKKEARKKIGHPEDMFLFGMIGANKENPPRKGYQEAIEAFSIFVKDHPDARALICNQQVMPGNFPIREYFAYLRVLDKTFFVNDYKQVYGSDPNDLRTFYNACDVLLHPSQTEGFGLCITEAMACGVPALVNNCMSMPELIVSGKTGYACRTLAEAKGISGRFTNDLSFVYPADVNSLVDNMNKIYKDLKEDEAKVKKACRDHVVANFNVEDTTKKFVDLLEELQEEILPLQPDPKPL